MDELVYVKLQPYVQTSVASKLNYKLSFRYFGPFKILAKVGNVAYKLDLPSTSMIHPVFHVSQLKKAIPPTVPVSSTLPDSISDEHRIPVKILVRRLVTTNNKLSSQILVAWSSWPLSMATWEDEVDLKTQFPAVPAWGQAGPQGGGDVTTVTRLLAPTEDGVQGEQLEQGEARRPIRQKKPNPRFEGPKWVRR